MKPSRPAPSFDRSIVDGPILGAVWHIAWPTMLQNMIAGVQGFVDHVMVGHYVGYNGNAAIGVSWQIFLVIIVFISSLYTGMGVLVARYAGAGDQEKVNHVVYQAFLTSSFLGLVVFAPAGYFASPFLLDLVHASPEVRAEALPYLRILFLFSVTMLHFFMLGGALRAAGDAKTPLRLGAAITVLNLALNIVLIRGLGPIPAFGTRGAAIGTVIASGVVSMVTFYLLFSGRLIVQFSRKNGLKPRFDIIHSLFRFGLPTGIQGIAMNVAGILMIRYVGKLADSAEAQAIYAVGYSQLFSFATWTSVALMAAAAAVSGQNLGAGRPERSRLAPRAATQLGLGVAIPLAALFLLVPRQLLALFDLTEPSVVALGSQLLAYLSVSCVFIMIALSYTGALQGMGDTRSPLVITLISQVALPLGWCAAIDMTRQLQASDIWLAIVLGHLLRSLLSVLRFRQGKWRDIRFDI